MTADIRKIYDGLLELVDDALELYPEPDENINYQATAGTRKLLKPFLSPGKFGELERGLVESVIDSTKCITAKVAAKDTPKDYFEALKECISALRNGGLTTSKVNDLKTQLVKSYTLPPKVEN